MNKKIYHIILCLCLLFLTQILAFAQQMPQKTENARWVRVESENKEISFAIPENFSFSFDKEGFTQGNPRDRMDFAEFKKVRALTAYENGATMIFESYDVSRDAKKVLSFLTSNHRDAQVADIEFENFAGFRATTEKTFYSAFFYFASDKNIYLVGVGARKADNEALAKFLNSVKLNNKTIFKLPAGQTVESGKAFSILDLRETPFEVVTMSKQEKKELEQKKKEAKDEKNESEPKTDPNVEGMIILLKPRSLYTDIARQNREQGKVLLRAAFGADGKIKEIKIIQGLKYGLTEQSLIALRRLRFIPAEKDGVPYTVTKSIEYSFSIY